jgi:hypothetical protein
MPSLRFVTTALAAGGIVQNLLTGSKFEYLPSAAAITVYAVADAAGVQLELTFGNVIECDQMDLPVKAATVGPNRSDDLIAAGVAAPGDRLQIKLQNTGAGATNIRTMVDIRPL